MSLKPFLLCEEGGYRLVLVDGYILVLEQREQDSLGGTRWVLRDKVYVLRLEGGRDYEHDTRIASMLVSALVAMINPSVAARL